MKKGILFIILIAISFVANAQTGTVRIKTSAICDDCKNRIEHDLSFLKGVKSSNVDLGTKEVTVIYNAEKTDPDKIRIAITKVGYDADTLKAAEKAFNKLPECCRVQGLH